MPHADADPELHLRSRVPASANGQLLLDYLSTRFRYHDRERWREEVQANRVQLDEQPANAGQRVRTGAWLCYRKHHVEPAVDTNFRVLHEEPGFLAVHKPAHLPMHADGPFVRNTLVSLLREHFGSQDLHPLHRLDRETSGVVLLARTQAAQQALRSQFAAGGIRKVYHAVVRGHVATDFTIDRPIGRSATSCITLRRAASEGALEPRDATTHCRVLARGPANTLLACEPTTGRTHQIRVHLEAAGHAVLGDKLYGRPDDDFLDFIRRVKAGGDARAVPPGEPDRQLLHASELHFVHPETAAPMVVVAPTPDCFAQWLQRG